MKRQTTEQREQTIADIVRRYGDGDSIRSIATGIGRSYGFVHRALHEAGVTFRSRGGNKRKKAVPAAQ